MRRVRAIGLMAMLALVATAAIGTASAAATDGKFAAAQYPVTVEGTPYWEQKLGTEIGNAPCQLTLSGGMTVESGNIQLTPGGTCSAFGSSYPLKANGCKFELNADWDSYSIGPKGCGPMTLQLFTCSISIPSQKGLSAQFATIAGTPKKVSFTSTTYNLKYTSTGSGCSGAGTKTGSLTGGWALATTLGVDLWYEAGKHLNSFESESYPATYTASQAAGNPLVVNTEAGKFQCTKVDLNGSASGAASTLTLSPTYSGCKAFGFLNEAIVATNGCSFVYRPNGTQDVSCPAGKSIEIEGGGGYITCAISIPAQSGLSSVAYEKATESGLGEISIANNVSGLTYTVTKDIGLCPFAGTGTRTNGTYTGGALVKGFDSTGDQRNIRVVK